MKRGYTLIEILISVSLSLFLLLGVAQLFRTVGSSITDAQATLNMSRNLNWAAMTLRNDLGSLTLGIDDIKNRFADPAAGFAGGDNGYFQIIEGLNVPYSNSGNPTHVSSTQVARNPDTEGPDDTVGDVDDILMFTVNYAATPLRGLINGEPQECPNEGLSSNAEIIYFVRGNTLYRRVLLILESSATLPSTTPAGFYQNNDLSVRLDGGALRPNILPDLSRREYRYGHWSNAPTDFPFPTHKSGNEAWYYLRMPILEECTHNSWPVGGTMPTLAAITYGKETWDSGTPPPATPYWDFWENPNGWSNQSRTGAMNTYAADLSDPMSKQRVGEDIILTNVISFDVKVWNPYWIPLAGAAPGSTDNWAPPQYVDLGQDVFFNPTTNTMSSINNGYSGGAPFTNALVGPTNDRFGFCSKGRYSKGSRSGETVHPGGGGSPGPWTGDPMPCVYDTWTTEYEQHPSAVITGRSDPGNGWPSGAGDPDFDNWECPPPYTTPLHGIEVTIRCFDPRSKNIKQIRIVKDFN